MGLKQGLKYREQIYKRIFLLSDQVRKILPWLKGVFLFSFILSSILFFIVFIFQIGFNEADEVLPLINRSFRLIFIVLFFSKFFIFLVSFKTKTLNRRLVDVVLLGFTLAIFVASLSPVGPNFLFLIYLNSSVVIKIGSVILIISELYRFSGFINSVDISPSLLFVTSFFIVIIIGSGLLMLPKAHTASMTYLDALFTSTSSVCVTGLIVVDTSTAFTFLGKLIIAGLIQVGGLGIMAFTGFFSYIFTGSSSFREHILLRDIFSSETMGGMLKVLTKIVVFTFLTELIGAVLIYLSLDGGWKDKLFFSAFHSVSAFCNAGFSTLSDGLFTTGIRNNYSVQMIVAFLVISGGLGFPIIIRFYEFLRQHGIRIIQRMRKQKVQPMNNRLKTSSRIVIVTTLFLVIIGTLFYLAFENNHSLAGMDLKHKLLISFFGSVSARTAGFNVVDISLWTYPTIFLMIALMWIGASPGSTGGGIKTTTFAIAIRAIVSNVRGNEQMEIDNRTIGNDTIRRVLSVIMLSLLFIFAGFIGLLLTDADHNPVHLLFETVSAFGTVGLSIANTATLSEAGKIIIILMMFIGRVGPLALLSAIFISQKRKWYKYPVQDFVIN